MKTVVHRYLTRAKTTVQPPGFADFIRGTIAVYQYSKQYNYTLKFDIDSHPIFKLLDIPSDLTVKVDPSEDTLELFPTQIDYNNMPGIIESMFKKNVDFNIYTNAFYKDRVDMSDEYNFIKLLLNPSIELQSHINTIKNSIDIDFLRPYTVIHVRLGDESLLYKRGVNEDCLNRIRCYIERVKAQYQQVLVISDSSDLKNKVSDLCNTTHSIPIHLGSLDKGDIDMRLLDTLSEFSIMSNSESIYCISYWDGSGFSRICSMIYSIPYYSINLPN